MFPEQSENAFTEHDIDGSERIGRQIGKAEYLFSGCESNGGGEKPALSIMDMERASVKALRREAEGFYELLKSPSGPTGGQRFIQAGADGAGKDTGIYAGEIRLTDETGAGSKILWRGMNAVHQDFSEGLFCSSAQRP